MFKKVDIKGQKINVNIYDPIFNEENQKYKTEFDYYNPFLFRTQRASVEFDSHRASENEIETSITSLLERVIKFPKIRIDGDEDKTSFQIYRPGESTYQWMRRFKAHNDIGVRELKKEDFRRKQSNKPRR